MPKGTPRFGSGPSISDLKPEVLGVIPSDNKILDPTPQGPSAIYETEDGTKVDLQEEAPPWELEDAKYDGSDARRYVDVPTTWTLRWINPRLLESQGWRYWRPVLKSDPRVSVKVEQMVAPDGNVRRGGAIGDILAWMPTTWVISRRKILAEETKRQAQSAVDKQEELRDQYRNNPYIRLEDSKHPRYTGAEGKSMVDI
jgi:hypothetical protein